MPIYQLTLKGKRPPNVYGGQEWVRRFVVVARDEARAREVVITAPVDDPGPGAEGAVPWSRVDQSDCVRITEWGPERIVAREAETEP